MELTIPFISPNLIKSLHRLRISQEAEKFAIAQWSIFAAGTNIYEEDK